MPHIIKAGLLVCTLFLTACVANQPQVRTTPEPQEQVPIETVREVSDTYRIALLLPLSGPSKDIGQAALSGAMMGFYEFHSPQDIELELYDTRGSADGARQAARTALNDNANIVVGPVFSANVAEVADIVTPQGLQVLALSNDKLAARENVQVLGPHLEGEVAKLLQVAIAQRSQSVLLFAPENGYGYRLDQEFQRLLEDQDELVFKTVLFPDRANVDELTQLISETGSFEVRSRQLKDILSVFEARYKKDQDASRALTYAVDQNELTQRWVERYPFTCEAPAPEEALAPIVPAGTVEADGTIALNVKLADDSGTAPKAQAYTHTRPCDIDVTEFAADLAREYALKQEADNLGIGAPPAPTMPMLEAKPEEPAAPLPMEHPSQMGPDYVFGDDELQNLMDNAPTPPSAQERLAEQLKGELEDAQFQLLDDMAVCLGYMAEKNYDRERGIDAMLRTMSKREVLGPPAFDTVILPLADDQLRIVSSLFDFYHVGPPSVRFLGDSQWDKIDRLYEEPSLREAKWLSVSRPFSEQGGARFEANFQQKPSYISALAFDALGLVFDQTNPNALSKSPPESEGFMMGESGAFRINDDGTNERLIKVKTLRGQEKTEADSTKPETLIRKASGPEFGEDRDMYLKRTCLGQY